MRTDGAGRAREKPITEEMSGLKGSLIVDEKFGL